MKFRDHRKHEKNRRGEGRDKSDVIQYFCMKFLKVYII